MLGAGLPSGRRVSLDAAGDDVEDVEDVELEQDADERRADAVLVTLHPAREGEQAAAAGDPQPRRGKALPRSGLGGERGVEARLRGGAGGVASLGLVGPREHAARAAG